MRRIRPLTPIFDPEKQLGAISVGNTPTTCAITRDVRWDNLGSPMTDGPESPAGSFLWEPALGSWADYDSDSDGVYSETENFFNAFNSFDGNGGAKVTLGMRLRYDSSDDADVSVSYQFAAQASPGSGLSLYAYQGFANASAFYDDGMSTTSIDASLALPFDPFTGVIAATFDFAAGQVELFVLDLGGNITDSTLTSDPPLTWHTPSNALQIVDISPAGAPGFNSRIRVTGYWPCIATPESIEDWAFMPI